MRLSAISAYRYNFNGFSDDLRRASESIKGAPGLDRYLKDGRTVIIERVEINEDNTTKGKLKKVGEGAATATAAGATGGAIAKTKGKLDHAQDAADTTSEAIDDTGEHAEAVAENIPDSDNIDIDDGADFAESIFDAAKGFLKSLLDLD